MEIGRPLEVVEIEPEPAVPYEGEEVAPDFQPETTPEEAPAEAVPAGAP